MFFVKECAMVITVAIVGRPNVGKSTLFNRLTGSKQALVDDTPGLTRDRREGDARIADLKFRIIDTAGLDEVQNHSLNGRIWQQTKIAIQQANMILMVIDVRAGVMPLDVHFANWLRKTNIPIVLLANKCETYGNIPVLGEAHKLGLGDPIAISAEHNNGFYKLYNTIYSRIKNAPDLAAEYLIPSNHLKEIEDNRVLKIAIVGRPNVGKSTLVNRLIEEDRLLTGPEAGITRDSIKVPWKYSDREIHLFDTAGLRRRAKVVEKLERMSTADSIRAIRFAEVVILVIDGKQMLQNQDLAIANTVFEQGRSMIIAVNKWDVVPDKKKANQHISEQLRTSLAQARGIPWIAVSALHGKNLNKLLKAVFDIYKIWNTRIATSRLNVWLKNMTEQHPLPLSRGRRLRLRYITQVNSRPPTFAAFINQANELPKSYVSYLIAGLRDEFGLTGVPIRLNLRTRSNPYTK
ncbi:small GTP-binding domain protein [Candidatus Endolissoclinum faulkneri L2]|uniref:GTPase Der n=1 Tax=Candidatus Endolissoclinum faulkneri L2 TaxID=1193729 RepID=K7YPU9_9PROT|nr:ribosome biogenesis GTPase Der [Candidatus Endolissoclinum faulkneri]AFX98599.1 small GTP-binding domain protein [Candidatus Endolissoclinum faulkneri L2]